MSTSHIGPYAVERELGAGGMGAVYRVHRDGETYALKWVHEQIASAPGIRERFAREIDAGRAVDDPHVVRTLDAGEHEGRPYLVMEYVEGRTLRELLDALGRLPEALLREVARQTAQGLVAIHAAGIVHRDVRPENILITDANEVRVMDLGVAKLQSASVLLTVAGQFAGSPLYASPEQVKAADEVGTATDLYSLGVVLYELASGRNPFAAPDLVGILQNHLTLVPSPLDADLAEISTFFAAVVAQLLAKDVATRLATSSDLLGVLHDQEESSWWAAREAAATAAARPKIPVGRETSLVGRSEALSELKDAWQGACRGDGGVLVVEGESGIGKTRLMASFLDEMDPTSAHLLYGAFEATGGLAGVTDALVEYFGASNVDAAVARLLVDAPAAAPALAARLRRQPAPPGSPDLTGETLHAVLARLVQALAAERPVAWVVDDVQLARQEGRDLILSLVRALEGHPVLFVLASHPGGIEVPEARRMLLSRLAPPDVRALLTDALRSADLAARLAPRIAEQSDGIPLFALELLRGMEAAGLLPRDGDGAAIVPSTLPPVPSPESLRALIEARLRALTDEDRDLLEAAAVQGVAFDTGLLGEALDLKRVRVLRQLASIERRTGMVRTQGDGYRFDVKQAQGVLLDSLADGLRREYHSLYYEAGLERIEGDAGGLEAEFLARHALHGTNPKEARRWLTPALAYLGSAYRLDEYLDLARAALDAPRLMEGAERGQLLVDLADRLDVLGLREEQQAALNEAAHLAEETGDAGLSARVAYNEAILMTKTGRFADAEAAMRDTIDRARTSGNRPLETRATGTLGTILDNTGRHEEGMEHLRAHLAGAVALEDPRSEMVARCNLSLALLHLQRIDEAEAEMEKHLTLAQEIGDRRAEAIACGNLSLIATRRGERDEARRLLERNIELAREIGDRRSEAIVTYNLAVDCGQEGRLADARAQLDHAHRLAQEIGDPRMRGLVESQQALLLHYLGRLEDALVQFEHARDLLESTGGTDSVAKVRQSAAYVRFELGRGPMPERADTPLSARLAAAERGDVAAALDESTTGPASVFNSILLYRDLFRATQDPEHLAHAWEHARSMIDHAPVEDREYAEAYYTKMLRPPD